MLHSLTLTARRTGEELLSRLVGSNRLQRFPVRAIRFYFWNQWLLLLFFWCCFSLSFILLSTSLPQFLCFISSLHHYLFCSVGMRGFGGFVVAVFVPSIYFLVKVCCLPITSKVKKSFLKKSQGFCLVFDHGKEIMNSWAIHLFVWFLFPSVFHLGLIIVWSFF